MKTPISIFLIVVFLPATCFANGKVAALKQGQKAPFDGILLDKKAEATIAAKRESAVKICKLEKTLLEKSAKASCKLDVSILNAQLNSEKTKHSELMKLKEAELKRLNQALKEPLHVNLWFGAGLVSGVALSLGIFYAAVQTSK
jgi:hypothetical protein|tara:strand:- start:4006 stop:4437 length:432 start_codon:yes stop_codon:yes gene_type:complete